MAIRKSAAKAATAAAVKAPVNAKAAKASVVQTTPKPERAKKPLSALQRADMVKRLVHPKCDAATRVVLLSGLCLGDVAAIAGLLGKASGSANEVMAIKMSGLYGNDWVAIAKALPADLCEADKTRRKAINAALEGIRETVKANCGGDAAKARDTLRAVKAWGEGKRKAKRGPKAGGKAAVKDFLKSWPILPSAYRRMMKDETADDIDLALGDAIAAWFKARNINPRHVLEISGKAAWN